MSDSATQGVQTQLCITLEGAQKVVRAGLEHAESIGTPSAVAVLDKGGNLLAFARQDGAPLIAGPYAIKKAWTSASIGTSTQGLWEYLSTDAAMQTVIAGDPELKTLGGGLPLTVDGQIIGAVGVSGGSYKEDDEIAQTAAASVS